MKYEFLDNSIDKNDIILQDSSKINPLIKKNSQSEIIKAIDFLDSDEKFLYIHGFMGTGKRQFINYLCEFLDKDVIKLEYYCKEATVCDDILLVFNEFIENLSISKAVNLNTKITTLANKFNQQISAIKKPFLIILHSLDDVLEENYQNIVTAFQDIVKQENVKIIVSTRALKLSVLGDVEEDRKIFLKAFSKEIFKEFLSSNQLAATEKTIEDFYKYTRGYYYYTALSIKILQAMKIDLIEFLSKFNQSGMNFDAFLNMTYINLIPTTIRNFFWFLRTVRHGLSINALAILELYDEFSIEYLKANLMIFQVDETIYVQDYFLQKTDISIPTKTEIKLHKYIIGIYENQLKAQIKDRAILISRQALRNEIEYHARCIDELENGKKEKLNNEELIENTKKAEQSNEQAQENSSIASLFNSIENFTKEKKYTDAIETCKKILNLENITLINIVEARQKLANLYKTIGNFQMAEYYYELVETYYLQHKELINLNYLYYDMTDLFFKNYKKERAIDTIKKVIYSVDTPQSLLVSACTLLGNIYNDSNNSEEAYSYYKKALDSIVEDVNKEVLAELYFKFALVNDDNENMEEAFKYYNKCIAIEQNNQYKALAYSNLASCYFDNDNLDDAKMCFEKAYQIEKSNNNFEGIYYTASQLGQIYKKENSKKTLIYLLEAKSSAEFINESFYILDATIALGDFFYNNPKTYKEALTEYFKAHNIAENLTGEVDIVKIKNRINDMKLRMEPNDFEEIESKYGNRN